MRHSPCNPCMDEWVGVRHDVFYHEHEVADYQMYDAQRATYQRLVSNRNHVMQDCKGKLRVGIKISFHQMEVGAGRWCNMCCPSWCTRTRRCPSEWQVDIDMHQVVVFLAQQAPHMRWCKVCWCWKVWDAWMQQHVATRCCKMHQDVAQDAPLGPQNA